MKPQKKPSPRFPALYQLNTRVYLTETARRLGRAAGLDDISDALLDDLVQSGFDWVWLLSVWQTGAVARQISRENLEWRAEFEHTLPDLTEEDIEGSGFAITDYVVHEKLGGDPALARLRERMRNKGLRLLLDFVPNHMAPDHPWATAHPDYFVGGTEADLIQAPENYVRLTYPEGDRIFAHGRDPFFPGWPDTLQLNYGNPMTQNAMMQTLVKIAGQCDGVRCDMAMLVLPEVFERTWGIAASPFWPAATAQVREKHPDFCFMAEVYWDLEWTLQQQGFDYTYDKRLYDRLHAGQAQPVRDHLRAESGYQCKMARFLENHDEPRAAWAFPYEMHKAAAVITFLSPGLRFFHQGQFDGRKKRISPHLCRAPYERVDGEIRQFYDSILFVIGNPALRDGEWQLLEPAPAWSDNPTHADFVCFGWQHQDSHFAAVVNFAPHQSQCYVRLPFPTLAGRTWRLADSLSAACYERNGDTLCGQGLYLDMPQWGYHCFEISEGE